MTDFRELKELDYEDSAIYRRTNGDVVQITRVDEKPPVRQWDGLSNTVYDFVHGYIEDQEVYSMKTLYQSLDNQELISIVSASGRDMTADTRLYLSARDYYDHLVALKAPQEALDAQQEIASVYLDHLKAYGDACVVMCKKNLAFADIDKYGSAEACLRASIDRMDAVAKGKVYELRLSEESAGTQKLMGLAAYLMTALERGATVVVDELDAKLHPKLLRYVILLFKDPEVNKSGAQLIFSSQDVSTMRNDVFRRDEIWFAARGEGKASHLWSLADIHEANGNLVSKNAAFDKQYLSGRYGADPYLTRIEEWD